MKRLILCCMMFCLAVVAYAKPNIDPLNSYLQQQTNQSSPLFNIFLFEDNDMRYFPQLLEVIDMFPPEGKKAFSKYTHKDVMHVEEIHVSFLLAEEIKSIFKQQYPMEEIFPDGLYSISFITNATDFKKSMYVFFATDRLRQLNEAQITARMAYEIYGHVYPFLFQNGYTRQSVLTREKTAYKESISFLNRVINSLQDPSVKESFLHALKEEQARLEDISK